MQLPGILSALIKERHESRAVPIGDLPPDWNLDRKKKYYGSYGILGEWSELTVSEWTLLRFVSMLGGAKRLKLKLELKDQLLLMTGFNGSNLMGIDEKLGTIWEHLIHFCSFSPLSICQSQLSPINLKLSFTFEESHETEEEFTCICSIIIPRWPK